MSLQRTHRGHPASTPLGRRFWSLWAANTFSSMGNGLNSVAAPLLAATLTRQPLLIAGVLFVSRLPWLIVAVPAGAFADRADRPRLMRAMDLARAGLLGAVAVLVATGHMTIALVYAFALAVGVCDTFFAGSTQAVLPAVVPGEQLTNANGLLSVGSTATEQTVGPAIGGFLFSWSRTIPFAADALSFIGSAAFLLGLGRTPRHSVVATPRENLTLSTRALRHSARAGLVWYRHSSVLCLVTGTVAVLSFSQAMVSGILVLFALERLGLSEVGYGLFMAGLAVGNVVGGLVAARVARRFGTATILVTVIVVAAVGYLAAGATTSPYLAAPLLAFEAVAVVVGNVATISFRQRMTPAPLQARVANIWRSVIWGVIPFGALAGGGLGAVFGLRVPFFAAAGLQLGLAVVVARPLHRLLRSPAHRDPVVASDSPGRTVPTLERESKSSSV